MILMDPLPRVTRRADVDAMSGRLSTFTDQKRLYTRMALLHWFLGKA